MKRVACLLLLAVMARAQAPNPATGPDLDALIGAGERWLEENVDTNVLRNLPELDEAKATELLQRFQKELQEGEVLDLARLRGLAGLALPWMEQDEAMKPFAPWLRSRLDYLEASEELNRLVPESPRQPSGKPAPKRPAPNAQQQARVWTRLVANEPWPAAAKQYLPKVKPVFAAERVPVELAWLAEVESSFDPKAKSPAGAAGLYQLMPDTAKAEGLSTFPFDQRKDPEKCAGAAARLLRRLHGRFRDWPLALAAYNAGEGRVQTLLTRHKATRFPEISRHLPAETQMYVPKVEAVILRREGKSLARL